MVKDNDGYERISYQKRQLFWDVVEGPYIVHLVIFAGLFIVLGPIFWEVVTSLKTTEQVYSGTVLPQDPTLSVYKSVLIDGEYWRSIVNSLIISTSTTVIVLLLSVPAGYAFSRYRFKFDTAIFLMIIGARMFPPIGMAVPYFEIIATLGLLDTKTGVIVGEVYLWLPLMIFIMRNFFMSIPESLDEAARVDGCTRIQAFRRIAVPLAKPGIASVSILTFLYSWREFLFALLASRTLQSMPIGVAVFRFVGESRVDWASLAAVSVMAIIPALLIVAFFQQYIVKGLTSGAAKG